jgi:lipopolysaccharide export LptBFGC system permease protein LptF
MGWQVFYGTILVLIGGSEIAKPEIAALAWPILLVAVGAVLLVRGTRRR